MKRFAKSFLTICLLAPPALVLAGDSSGTPAPKLNDLFTNDIVAKGTGVSVTRSQLDDAMVAVKSSAAAQGRMIPPDQMTEIEQQQLQNLIGQQVLLAQATDPDKASAKGKFADVIKKIKENGKMTDEEFDKKLNQQLLLTGQTKAQWDKHLLDEVTIRATLERQLKVSVSEDDVKKFYDDNPAKFEEPEMVRAAHILFSTSDLATHKEYSAEKKAEQKKLAEEVLKRARAGEDFAKLAKQYSDDPGSKDEGGEYTFPRGKMVPEFEAAAFSMNTNQISDLVTTQFGYHIIKLYEKIPAKKVSLDKVKEDIKEYLSQKQIQAQLPEYVDKLEKSADVQILDPSLKPPDTSAVQGKLPGLESK